MLNPSNGLQNGFDSGNLIVNDNNGNPWLSMSPGWSSPTYSSVQIQDLNTLSSILIEQHGGSGLNLYNLWVSSKSPFSSFIGRFKFLIMNS